MLLNISASPFVLGKNEYRHKLFSFQAKRWQLPIVYVNQVGGNDELVFDGKSNCVDPAKFVIWRIGHCAFDGSGTAGIGRLPQNTEEGFRLAHLSLYSAAMLAR